MITGTRTPPAGAPADAARADAPVDPAWAPPGELTLRLGGLRLRVPLDLRIELTVLGVPVVRLRLTGTARVVAEPPAGDPVPSPGVPRSGEGAPHP